MAHAGILTEHYFVYTMSETHVYRDFHLVLLDHFVAGMSLPPSPTRLKFLDCAGHSWDVYSKRNVYNQFALHRTYWALFSLHHLLEEGDVCVFALKEIEPVRSVLVHIFRVVPVTSTDSTSVHSHYKTHEINATKTCTPNS
ncbi:hypothetical protein KC19_5G087700 [Ceratodon purpureus]|uniref:TF-B3 domain-containing protein n=1 Tax=Ceratodon purpureus TaxID=3225 RepID=A0A8T0I0W1_CERPU|nr:hypothetical protein KC19_5G087700 [Ceratodon purpureus]